MFAAESPRSRPGAAEVIEALAIVVSFVYVGKQLQGGRVRWDPPTKRQKW